MGGRRGKIDRCWRWWLHATDWANRPSCAPNLTTTTTKNWSRLSIIGWSKLFYNRTIRTSVQYARDLHLHASAVTNRVCRWLSCMITPAHANKRSNRASTSMKSILCTLRPQEDLLDKPARHQQCRTYRPYGRHCLCNGSEEGARATNAQELWAGIDVRLQAIVIELKLSWGELQQLFMSNTGWFRGIKGVLEVNRPRWIDQLWTIKAGKDRCLDLGQSNLIW